MTSYAAYPPERAPLWPLLLVIVVAIAIAAVTVDLSISHGVAKHGYSAEAVRQCLNDNGPALEWKNPANGRLARVCELAPGAFGIQIVNDRWQEITSFTKEKFSRLEQVTNYLKNTGYGPQ